MDVRREVGIKFVPLSVIVSVSYLEVKGYIDRCVCGGVFIVCLLVQRKSV